MELDFLALVSLVYLLLPKRIGQTIGHQWRQKKRRILSSQNTTKAENIQRHLLGLVSICLLKDFLHLIKKLINLKIQFFLKQNKVGGIAVSNHCSTNYLQNFVKLLLINKKLALLELTSLSKINYYSRYLTGNIM